MRSIIFSFLCLFIFGCGTKQESQVESVVENANGEKETDVLQLNNYVVNESMDSSLVQTIDFTCVVVVIPTDEQVEKMITENGEENFATIADDYSFYQTEALQKIDSAGIPSRFASRRYIKLVAGDNTWLLDVRKEKMPAWNLIFFEKSKEPMIVPAMTVTADVVKNYFVKE